MTTRQTFRLRSFGLATQDIASVNPDSLHGLSMGVEWPHRPGDWEMLRAVGHGFVALDDIGRVFSSAMWFPHGRDCATVGMVITDPRVQTHGGGRWMMDRLLEDCGERRLILNATRAAFNLYASLGFVSQATVYQCQGVVTSDLPPVPAGPEAVAPVPVADLAEILALDAAAFGAQRCRLLHHLAGSSAMLGLRRGERWIGYAVSRPFGRGQVIGPVVAESEDQAARLVAAFLAERSGCFVRIDTRQDQGAFRSFLQASGLSLFDTVRTMTRGTTLAGVETGAPAIYGLGGHAFG